MALAILELDGADGDGVHRFRVQLGSNRFYRLAIGDGTVPDVRDGFELMAAPTHVSPLHGPLAPEAMGRTVIDVPAAMFDRDNRHVQLLSFSRSDFTGPAASELLAVSGVLGAPGGPFGTEFPPLSPIPFSLAASAAAARPVVPFRGEAPRMTTAMAIEWAGLLSGILPALGGVVGDLVKGAMPDVASLFQPPAAPKPGVAPTTEDAIRAAITALIDQLRAGSSAKPPAVGADGTVQAHSLELPPEAHLSNAMIAPALLAALPALMPLLQQVLSPETIKGILATADPNRLIATITNGLKDLATVGQADRKEQDEHLEKLNPGVNAPELVGLMESMGLNRSLAQRVATPRPGVPYTRATQVTLSFADLVPLQLGGRPVPCVLAGRELSFPLAVETPRPLPGARLRVKVTDAHTLKPLARREWPVDAGSATGRLAVVPVLGRTEVAALAPGTDVLVDAELTWPGGRGRGTYGTSISQLVAVVPELSFDHVEQAGEVVALDDVQKYREFWHKAWQGTFDGDARGIDVQLRYHYAVDPAAHANAVMRSETDTTTSPGRRLVGTLRSGMQLSPYSLNALLGRMGRPQLGAAELAALATPAAADRLSLAARTRVRLRGRPGASAAIWVFPEVKVQDVVLMQAAAVNAAGHVTQLSERRAGFPIPVIAHVVGVTSE